MFADTTQTIVYPSNSNNYQVILTLAGMTDNYTAITGRVIIAGSSPEVGLENALVGLYLYNAAEQTETLIANQKTNQLGYYAFTDVTGGNQYRVRAIRIVSGDIFCACCGQLIPYVCIGVRYNGVINLYEADYRGYFRIILPINTACIEIRASAVLLRT